VLKTRGCVNSRTAPALRLVFRFRSRMPPETTMLHVYGWRRDGGPFFLDNPRTLEDGGPESAD
jgi:hypothetical protein